jgi:hypothetical protein
MSKDSKKASSDIEFHSDAWQRFERAADVVAKRPPQHRIAQKVKKKKKSKALMPKSKRDPSR